MASVAISRLFRRTFRSSFGITRAASTPSGSVSHNGTHANAYVESRSEQSLREHSLWRVSNSPFVEVPQAWVTTFDTHDERRIGLLELHPDIFRVSPRLDILHKNLTWQQVYRNVQLTKMLSKAEMPGGGRKPWPQKKTGRAHVGSVRSPQFIRGGFAHGARGPRSWFYMLPDSVRLQGLCIALTIKHVQDDLHIVDTLDTLSDGDPQYLMDLAENRNWGYSVLFVNDTDEISGGLAEASLALPSFTVMPYYGLNCFSLLKYDTIVFSRNALELVQSRLLHGLHRAESLNKKYRYADFKEKILAEGKAEEHSTQPPPV